MLMAVLRFGSDARIYRRLVEFVGAVEIEFDKQLMQPVLSVIDEREHDRDDDERQQCGRDQTADNGNCHRCARFGTGSDPNCNR